MKTDKASETFVVRQVESLKTAFPRHKDDFFALLAYYITLNAFTEKEVTGIINQAINTITNPLPTIGEIIHEQRKEKQANTYD
jgi:hypothetical protein